MIPKYYSFAEAFRSCVRYIFNFQKETLSVVMVIACIHFLALSPFNPYYHSFLRLFDLPDLSKPWEYFQIFQSFSVWIPAMITLSVLVFLSLLERIYLISIFIRYHADNSEPMLWKDLLRSFIFMPALFIADILYAVLVVSGSLLILPGLIWSVTYMFYSFALIQQRKSFFQAFTHSASLVYGIRWPLFGLLVFMTFFELFLVQGVVMVFSSYEYVATALAYLLSAIFTVFKTFIFAAIYLQLNDQHVAETIENEK